MTAGKHYDKGREEMIIHVKFIAIVGSAPSGWEPTEFVTRYLYSNTHVDFMEMQGRRFVGRLKTEGATDRAASLEAKAQADRFSSGLVGAKVFDEQAQADVHSRNMAELYFDPSCATSSLR